MDINRWSDTVAFVPVEVDRYDIGMPLAVFDWLSDAQAFYERHYRTKHGNADATLYWWRPWDDTNDTWECMRVTSDGDSYPCGLIKRVQKHRVSYEDEIVSHIQDMLVQNYFAEYEEHPKGKHYGIISVLEMMYGGEEMERIWDRAAAGAKDEIAEIERKQSEQGEKT